MFGENGYTSDAKLKTADIYDLMDELSQMLPWIWNCVNKIDVTNIGHIDFIKVS